MPCLRETQGRYSFILGVSNMMKGISSAQWESPGLGRPDPCLGSPILLVKAQLFPSRAADWLGDPERGKD